MEGESAAAGTPAGEGEGSTDTELARLAERLESLSRELDSEPEQERAAELVREASELAGQVGREVEKALRAASQVRDAPGS